MTLLFDLQFWEVISEEHGITPDGYCTGKDPNQVDRLNVYFDESSGELTRSPHMHTEPVHISSYRKRRAGKIQLK